MVDTPSGSSADHPPSDSPVDSPSDPPDHSPGENPDPPPSDPPDDPSAPKAADPDAARRHDDLRQHLRRQRAAIRPIAQRASADSFHQHCLPLLQGVRHIAGYLAIAGEMPVESLLDACREQGAVTCAPYVGDESLSFLPFDAGTPMQHGHFGIRTPDVALSAAVPPESLNVVLVPLVGFDAQGNRLGMGGGYYDRTFAFRRRHAAPPLLIGCAHAFQQVPTVWPDWWDVPLDAVVTDAGVAYRA